MFDASMMILKRIIPVSIILGLSSGFILAAEPHGKDEINSRIHRNLPQGWVFSIIDEIGKKGHPHGLEEPLFRVDYSNPHVVFEDPKANDRTEKTSPELQLFFYDIKDKDRIMKVIASEKIYSWNIPIYFGESDELLIVTSPSYVNHGIFTEKAKKAIYPIWKTIRLYFPNKEDISIEQLASPD
jgi:hypothetical protein